MAHPTAVILVVGLTSSLLGQATPNMSRWARNRGVRRLKPVLPAVTCSVQSSMVTGAMPRDHGIVGNGWYNRELAEVQFWKQSNGLVRGERVWETARRRDPSITCANLFWWYNMYSSVDYSVTPRPIYKADGRKLPDVYTEPASLRDDLQGQLGTFPLFNFWGPAASIRSSQWIADAAMQTHRKYRPSLSFVYLPHLDYPLQKLGPDHDAIPGELRRIDEVVGQLLAYFEQEGVRTLLVSEYGIDAVNAAVPINRVLRQARKLRVREEQGLELLDPGASDAFAVVDHQLAHVYVKDPSDVERVGSLCRDVPGVEQVLDRTGQAAVGIDHERGGELVLVADKQSWFTYDYWLDDARAPDFARTVDIHRKPGYDPRELFVDPRLRLPKVKIASTLLRKKLGFRTLFDVIPLDSGLVRGSHGRIDQDPDHQPVLIGTTEHSDRPDEVPCTAVRDVILEHLFDEPVQGGAKLVGQSRLAGIKS